MELHTSETISDTSNTSTNNELSLSFDIANGGTETVYVDEKLLTNYEVAKARAESIFLEQGYDTKRVSISTYHIDNLHIGHTIQLDDLLFKVITIRDVIKGAKVSMEITAERAFLTSSISVTYSFVSASEINYSMISEDGYIYGGTNAGGEIYRSLDGDTWVLVYNDAVFSKVSKIVYNDADGYIYAALTGTDTKFVKSLNGTDWVDGGTISSRFFSDFVPYDGYLYIATFTSPLGIYDTEIVKSLDTSSFTAIQSIDERIYQFIVKDSSLFFSSFKFEVESIYQTVDGATFSKISDLLVDDYISVMNIFNGYIVGGNDSGRVYRSVDGVTWQKMLDNVEYEIYTMTSNLSGVYIPTNAGKIIFSADLVTWKEIYDLTSSVAWLWAVTSNDSNVYVFDDASNCYTINYTDGNE